MDRNEGNRAPEAVRYVVYSWVPEDMLAEWNEWHNHVHIPHVLAAPQMKGVRKFRVQDSTGDLRFRPQFVTMYELSSVADFESYRSGPGVEMKREYEARYGGIGKIARMLLVETPLTSVRVASAPGDLMLVRSLFGVRRLARVRPLLPEFRSGSEGPARGLRSSGRNDSPRMRGGSGSGVRGDPPERTGHL